MADVGLPKHLLAELDRVNAASGDLLEDATSAAARRRRGLPISLQRESANPKLAPQRAVRTAQNRTRFEPLGPYVTSTYVSIDATCPSSCPFKGAGCYASAGMNHLTMGRLDSAAEGWEPLEVTLAEARAIDSLWSDGVPQDGGLGGRDLRLHVGGEVSCVNGARALGAAAERWLARGGGAVWTYTHRWREIPWEAWGPISVLASLEDPAEIPIAKSRGYPAAITVPEFSHKARWYLGSGTTAVACPYERGGRPTCSQCRLCLGERDLLDHGEAIAFAAHGRDAKVARRRLRVIGGAR